MIIAIEDEKTWPSEVLDILKDNLDILSKHATWEWESPSYNLPYSERRDNPYSGKRYYILEEINELIKDSCVIGYHCTRLLEHEISDIAENGLGLPSRAFLERRLKEAMKIGVFTLEEMQLLMNRNAYLEPHSFRENKIYFVCGASELKVESGIQKFFRCWGGEAVFNPHENQTFLFKKLCAVGIPCIIRVKLRQKTSTNLAKNLVASYLCNRNIEASDTAAYDDWLFEPLPKEQILKIISFTDPEFIELTEHHGWDNPITS